MFVQVRRPLAVLLLTGRMAWLAAAPAEAGYPYVGGFGFGYWPSLYQQEHVPYYALHPPVYYSAPVPRPYGYSPFAYPPGYRTPEVQSRVAPKLVYNEFVVRDRPRPTADRGEHSVRRRPEPLTIRNPYFDPAADQVAERGSEP